MLIEDVASCVDNQPRVVKIVRRLFSDSVPHGEA